ncbi:MAG: S8 family peptidase [Rubrivivax sp.]|nr:S8 family peptidase [Rubrivivax sp.]
MSEPRSKKPTVKASVQSIKPRAAAARKADTAEQAAASKRAAKKSFPKKAPTKKTPATKAVRKATLGRVPAGPGAKSAGAAVGGGGSESVVVYIHGIGQQEAPGRLKQRWDLALFGRDLGPRSRMAFWSDLVHETLAGGTRAAGTGRTDDLRDFDLDVVLSSRVLGKEAEAARNYGAALAWRLGVETQGAGPGKKVLPLPAWLRRPISRLFLETLVGDTAAYFFNPSLRRQVGDRLREVLRAVKGRPVTLVAHSQGSIIAYEVLSKLKAGDVDLDAFVTIGSPLGLQEVQDLLVPKDGSIPAVVGRWVNFADPLDPVAADKQLSSDFGSEHASVQDDLILNTQSRRLFGFNPHAATGYLAHPKVRSAVCDAMGMDVMSRFVMARDVAERLDADPDVRHSVLIEVLEPGYAALGEDPVQLKDHEQAELDRLRSSNTLVAGDAITLATRVLQAAAQLRTMVGEKNAKAARIDTLRRFVSARLTADELQRVAAAHDTMRVYSVWQSSPKHKLTNRASMAAIKADAALSSFTADGNGITWAVLDTGIRADHPHFAQRIKAVWDCTQEGPPRRIANATDRDGHGTHVAGIIAGQGAVGPRQYRGVAPLARLVIYKVLDDKGNGEDAWIIKALDHIAAANDDVPAGMAVHGLNLSLGAPFDTTVYGCGFSPLCAELRQLWRNGVLVVTASGNEGQLQVQTPQGEAEIYNSMSIADPANLEEGIAVGSVNRDRPHLYGVSAFSSRGPTADGRLKPDVVAPGERIVSCASRWKDPHYSYREDSGTSMAAPHVSGLLAAFLSVRPEFRGRPDEVKAILLRSCTDLGRDRYHQGHGLPNLMQMLLSV